MMTDKTKRSPGRPPKKPGGDQETQHKLLSMASALFMERGYEQVSLELIAEKCQVTKATVYYYFTNKSRLFTESVVFVLGMARDVTARLLNEPLPLKERLIRIATGHLTVNRADFPTMMKEASAYLSDEQLLQIREAEEAIHGVMADSFRDAADKGELEPLPPVFLSHAFSALLMLGNRRPVMNAYASPEQAARQIVALFMEGTARRKE